MGFRVQQVLVAQCAGLLNLSSAGLSAKSSVQTLSCVLVCDALWRVSFSVPLIAWNMKLTSKSGVVPHLELFCAKTCWQPIMDSLCSEHVHCYAILPVKMAWCLLCSLNAGDFSSLPGSENRSSLMGTLTRGSDLAGQVVGCIQCALMSSMSLFHTSAGKF